MRWSDNKEAHAKPSERRELPIRAGRPNNVGGQDCVYTELVFQLWGHREGKDFRA